jgi:DNA-binding NtrC family response regulator
MRQARILIVDDEPGMLEVCADTLEYLGEDVLLFTEQDSLRAAKRLAEEPFDLLLTDLRMPGMTGIELLTVGREHDPDLPVLVVTAYPSVEDAVSIMKMGSIDYITKPFLPDDLLLTVRKLLESRKLQEEVRLLRRQVEKQYQFGEMIGESKAMQQVFAKIEQVAKSDVDVLILGETGTGKELVARSVHRLSERKERPFVPVDCGAIPDNLLESELFGYEKGAFTGATSRSIGLMQFAYRGTFFLDELGELPMHMQAKLLRVLQERKVRPIGGREEHPIDVRVIAATRRDIDTAVREHRFREDLFFRINVVRIELPPLRERREDIELLARHFLQHHQKEGNQHIEQIAPDAMLCLQEYVWPGNVRELQNAIRHAIAMSEESILQVSHLPDQIKLSGTTLPIHSPQLPTPSVHPEEWMTSIIQTHKGLFGAKQEVITAFESHYLHHLLIQHQGDVSAAARAADVPRGTFYRLMKKHHIRADVYRKKSL